MIDAPRSLTDLARSAQLEGWLRDTAALQVPGAAASRTAVEAWTQQCAALRQQVNEIARAAERIALPSGADREKRRGQHERLGLYQLANTVTRLRAMEKGAGLIATEARLLQRAFGTQPQVPADDLAARSAAALRNAHTEATKDSGHLGVMQMLFPIGMAPFFRSPVLTALDKVEKHLRRLDWAVQDGNGARAAAAAGEIAAGGAALQKAVPGLLVSAERNLAAGQTAMQQRLDRFLTPAAAREGAEALAFVAQLKDAYTLVGRLDPLPAPAPAKRPAAPAPV